MALNDELLASVRVTLKNLEDPSFPLSSILMQAMRIARLRNDFDTIWWLHMELSTVGDRSALRRRFRELAPHYTNEEYKQKKEEIFAIVIEGRKMDLLSNKASDPNDGEGKLQVRTVRQIEDQIAFLEMQIEKVNPYPYTDPNLRRDEKMEASKHRVELMEIIEEYSSILGRIRQRVFDFLSLSEKELIYGQTSADIFEKNRRYVDERLGIIAPEILSQFKSANLRLSEDDIEARSQALVTCRRILKVLADRLYPPQKAPVLGPDGIEHDVSEERYIARLWQYVFETSGKHRSGKLIMTEINQLGARIDKIYELDNKGIHDRVSQAEVEQCVIHTYIIVGDILRIEDGTSAILVEDEPFQNTLL